MKPSDIRILVVDDDVDLAESIFELFQTFKFSVDVAHSGNEAWEKLEKREFHIVLTDLRMNDGNGLELAQKIRKRNPNYPAVLLISGYSDLQLEEIYNEGIDGFFAKPFDGTSVRDAISKCLLDPVTRWSNPGRINHQFKLNRKLKSVDSSFADRSAVFGRGGFFVSHSFAPPQRGTSVSFSLKFDDPVNLKFDGEGIVRWFQTNQILGAPAGLGIEITSMDVEDSKKYRELFGSSICHIPSPRKMVLKK